MIRHVTLGMSLFLAGGGLAFSQVVAPGQISPELEVIVTNGAGKEKHLRSLNGVVPMVLVRPNQAVPITLQFPIDTAGTPVMAMPLDGGEINGGNLAVLSTGKVVFTFRPVPAPGRYRLVVRTPAQEHLLEFYVVDANHHPFRPRPGSPR